MSTAPQLSTSPSSSHNTVHAIQLNQSMSSEPTERRKTDSLTRAPSALHGTRAAAPHHAIQRSLTAHESMFRRSAEPSRVDECDESACDVDDEDESGGHDVDGHGGGGSDLPMHERQQQHPHHVPGRSREYQFGRSQPSSFRMENASHVHSTPVTARARTIVDVDRVDRGGVVVVAASTAAPATVVSGRGSASRGSASAISGGSVIVAGMSAGATGVTLTAATTGVPAATSAAGGHGTTTARMTLDMVRATARSHVASIEQRTRRDDHGHGNDRTMGVARQSIDMSPPSSSRSVSDALGTESGVPTRTSSPSVGVVDGVAGASASANVHHAHYGNGVAAQVLSSSYSTPLIAPTAIKSVAAANGAAAAAAPQQPPAPTTPGFRKNKKPTLLSGASFVRSVKVPLLPVRLDRSSTLTMDATSPALHHVPAGGLQFQLGARFHLLQGEGAALASPSDPPRPKSLAPLRVLSVLDEGRAVDVPSKSSNSSNSSSST